MGARIKGAGTDTIRITGVEALHGCSYTIIPDQIETGTYMIMAAATHGDVLIKNCIPIHMESVSAKLSDAGAVITEGDDWIRVSAPGQLKASVITETIFEQRYRHLEEMRRMGAKARVEDRIAIIEGVDKLYGRCVEARDLRAGAALITAGLMAEGTTTILGGRYIERGYERIDQKLQGLGAQITVQDR